MHIRLLGAVEAGADGVPLPLGGPRQRAVLADLALHAGQSVPTGQLIDDLWGARPPASAKPTLASYVFRLRHVLNASGATGVALVTRPAGYMLDAEQDRIDVWRFRELAGRGGGALERGDAAAAVTLLTSALALCRGPALADIREAPFAVLAGQRLDDERLTGAEKLVEARLRLGQHRELVPELEALIAGSPYRETFHAQLMLTLYRSGRQAEALTAYRRARELLAGELGIEPGPELRELQRAILLQAPELELAGGGGVRRALRPVAAGLPGRLADQRRAGLADRPAGVRRAGERGGRAWRWTAVAAVLGLAAVGLPVLLTAGPAGGKVLADGVGELSAAGGGIARSLALPGPPGAALRADGSVWVTSPEGNVVYRIDPVTASVAQAIPVGAGPSAITAAGPDIWVANALDGTVSRINAATGRVVQTVAVGTEPTGIAAGGGSIWVANAAASTLSALSDVTGHLTATTALASAPFGVAFGAGSVWVTSPAGNSITRVDPRSGQPGQQIPVGSGPTAITFGLGSVWVANGLDSTVSRVDPGTDAIAATIPVGDGPVALAVDGNTVWAAARLSSVLTRINAGTNAPQPPIPVGGGPVALAAAGRSVWVGVGPAGSSRPGGGTLRVVSVARPASIDPALLYPDVPPQFSDATYDTLVTYQKTSGSGGLQLVPDLALAMPTVTADGTVYTFTLRPGLRYSTGRPVRAQDFRYAIERVLDLNPEAASFLDKITGAAACTPGKHCDLTRGVIANDSAGTVTFRLTAPDPDFLYKLAFEFTAPVPPNIPARAAGQDPVPGTGPYMITRYVPGREAVFSRNPYFREWSAAAQPAGSPDRIVWTFGTPVSAETAEIENGQADWTPDEPLPGVAGLIARFPGQIHISPLPAMVYTAFNTRAAPFSDPRVRRAFSLAADRAKFVSLLGGPAVAEPTCQILPPGIPGYRPYCPFTVDASTSGTWLGPDRTAARRLVAASGTKGMRVTVWSDNEPPDGTTAAFTVSVLRELGYRATVHLASHAAVVRATNDSRLQIQATDGSWGADYPSASDFFDVFFRCSDFRLNDPAATRNGSFFCDPAADRLMNRADSQQPIDPAQAAATWTAVDRAVTHAAPWVTLAILNNLDFLSARVTNYQYNPFVGVLLDQLHIRQQPSSRHRPATQS